MKEERNKSALVLLSGGQDSATCLLWALANFPQVECISFDYGQIHRIELDSGQKICKLLNVERKVIGVNLNQLTISSLLSGSDPNQNHPLNPDLPGSFLPGRNILFLTLAGIYAYTKGINNLVIGACETDYSGYPDCRERFISIMEETLNAGLQSEIWIYAPLMHLSKKDSILLVKDLPNAMEVLSLTRTCYNGYFPPCGECPACRLRQKGFEEAGIKDPALEE
jgi:7-cyano-7-deazaguanine synthase